MLEVFALVERLARHQITVLVTGETGTGKELVARAIHNLSPRRDRPLVVVDCTTLPESLFESEVFGYERGAFTGADRAKSGLLKEADGGTIFFDEISEIPGQPGQVAEVYFGKNLQASGQQPPGQGGCQGRLRHQPT